MKNTLKNITERSWFPFAAIALAAALVYGRTLFFGFTGLDDDSLILNNMPFLTKLSSIPAAFARDAFAGAGSGAYYRPLLTLSFIWDAALGGSAPFFYHLTNLVLHAGAAMALYAFLRALGKEVWFALTAALVFCVHPLLSQAVAWVPGRNDLLLALFALLSFTAFIQFLGGKKHSLLPHLLCYACALFTKEGAIVLPPLFALYALWVRPSEEGRPALLRPALAWLAITAAWFLARAAALHGVLPGGDFSALAALVRNLPAFFPYLGKVLFPFNLSTMPVLADMSLLPGLAALALICGALYLGKATLREATFGWLWFTLWLLPSFARPLTFTDFAEHRVYVPFIGLLLIAGAFRFTRERVFVPALALVVLLGSLSAWRLGVFTGRPSFWENAVATSPSNVVARTKLGVLYFGAGLYPQAGEQWQAGLRLAPGDAMLTVNMGSLRFAEGRTAEARVLWEQALETDPLNKKALNNLTVLYVEEKDLKKAAVCVDRLLALGAKVQPALIADTARYRKGGVGLTK